MYFNNTLTFKTTNTRTYQHMKRKEYNWDQTAEDVYKICRKVAGQK